MFNLSKQLSLCIVSICLALVAEAPICAEPHSNATKPIQNSKKAIQFFQEEIDFTTNPHAVKEAIEKQDKTITIVDVRSAKDFAEGHIPGAINIPYEKFNGFHGNETEFQGLRKDGYNYVYCYELLCNLAKDASIKFATLGYPVKEMVGGFNAWKEKGNPIEK